MSKFSGSLVNPIGKFALVASRFNALVVERLVAGAEDGLIRHGVVKEEIDVYWVPGALEIPLITSELAKSQKYVAMICLGTIIRGDTSHYDVVVNQSAAGIAQLAVAAGVPILNAILTTESMEQALDRAGGKAGNKGFDAALAAIEMVNLLAQIRRPTSS